LEARRAKLRADVIAQLKAKRVADLEAELEQSKETLTFLRQREQRLLGMLADLNRQSKDKGEEALKLGLLVREVDEEEKIVTAIINEVRSLKLDMVAPSRAKPLDDAVVLPNRGKKRLLLTLGSAGTMMSLILGGVALWEFRKRKVECVDEVVHGF